MRIQHPRRHYTGTEIHQARRLEFVDGVAETDDNVALEAALSVRGYWRRDHVEPLAEVYADATSVAEAPKRKRSKAADHSLEDDVDFTPEHEPTIDD